MAEEEQKQEKPEEKEEQEPEENESEEDGYLDLTEPKESEEGVKTEDLFPGGVGNFSCWL